ncbi:hypothetical protein ACQKGD_10760 [Peribacillus frigoritolerans]|uniref:hypothetical protein n=1 Tax=Peribacillus frigoritolerans TaxID=450367 RepID=UPI003CFC5D2C
MEAYLIGTVVQWVGLIAGLVWIVCGLYQCSEIQMRKKALKNIERIKDLEITLTQILFDKRISFDIREEYTEKVKKVIRQS